MFLSPELLHLMYRTNDIVLVRKTPYDSVWERCIVVGRRCDQYNSIKSLKKNAFDGRTVGRDAYMDLNEMDSVAKKLDS